MEKLRLLKQVRSAMRTRHYSVHTEKTCILWIKRFILVHGKRHPVDTGEPEITAFLIHLAIEKHVAILTWHQGMSRLNSYKEPGFRQ